MSITAVRVGDRDRENTADLLSQALAQGYFDLAEYEIRVQSAFAAVSTEQLRGLVADLPVDHLRRSDPRRISARKKAARASVWIHLAGYLAMVAIVLTVWLAVALTTGETAYFWPVWPILGGAIGLLGHLLPVRSFCR
ncbi:DUF1707 domain-containing protein [Mycolicibacterium sp. P1-5]|uniref:DUF1707 domain-containing protein n=1 Tax=Mycolicibacterium sp. P1-5 TaxID=2024617 RepID=UPI0011EDA6B9|nr:DUF1707 domain-containing protein [Mycolicibacterium sp. P1-5]KAA0110807.1 DUF1707 domain-containing protein [Mycolicibacterium sp. P1-5]